MNKPLFSVLLASYNNGLYLMEAVESVRRQTYANWEIIIVDDESVDNSKQLYKKLENDSRIHIYYNTENKGAGFTKRRCAELANGELLGFLDTDDALTNDALETMVDTFEINSDICLAYSRFYYCDNNLNIICTSDFQKPIPVNKTALECEPCPISHFVAFRNSFYKKTAGITPYLYRAVDHDLYFRMEEVGKTLFIDKCLYYYRTGTGNNISLDKNVGYAVMNDIVVKAEACIRRRMPFEPVVKQQFTVLISNYTSIIEEQRKEICRLRKSASFRLGNTILYPLIVIKDFVLKLTNSFKR